MVNKAFGNSLDQLDNLTDSLNVLILMDKTTFQHILPISFNASKFDSKFSTAPKTLEDFVYQYQKKGKIFDLKERYINMNLELPNKIPISIISL